MLNHDKPHLKRIAEENGYQESELIKADQVKVYVAEKALMPLEEGQKRRKRDTHSFQLILIPSSALKLVVLTRRLMQ